MPGPFGCCLFRFTPEAKLKRASIPGAGTEQLRSWQRRRIHKLTVLLQHQSVCKVLSISITRRDKNDVGFLLLFQSCRALAVKSAEAATKELGGGIHGSLHLKLSSGQDQVEAEPGKSVLFRLSASSRPCATRSPRTEECLRSSARWEPPRAQTTVQVPDFLMASRGLFDCVLTQSFSASTCQATGHKLTSKLVCCLHLHASSPLRALRLHTVAM